MERAEAALRAALGGGAARSSSDDASALLRSLGETPGAPDFDRLAAASGVDVETMRRHAADLWKHMDDLAERSPEEYRAFLAEQAKNAGVTPPPSADAPPAFGSAAPAGGGAGGARSDPPSAQTSPATFLIPVPQTLEPPRERPPRPSASSSPDDGDGCDEPEIAVVAIRRATRDLAALATIPKAPSEGPVPVRSPKTHPDARAMRRESGPPRRWKREKVALPDPRTRGASTNSNAAASSPEYSPESLLSGELLLSGSASSPPPLDATVYEVEAHPDAVRAALEDAAFRAFLAESAMLHVERVARPGVRLDRARGRRCYTARRDATPATAAAAAVSALRRDGDPSAGAFKMSESLLESIASMAVVDDRQESAARGEGRGKGKPKPLVEEVRDWSVRVARGADAAPVAVEVTVTLPGVRSAGDADLEVTERYVRVRFGEESRVVALPVAVDPGTATAAFKKKTKTLVIKADARRKEAGTSGAARGGDADAGGGER